MTICTGKAGDTQVPATPKCAKKMRREAQDIVSRCQYHLENLDRRFVLIAFEGGLISGKEAEAHLTEIEAGRRPKGVIKSLIIEHYTHGKLSADKVSELFERMELGGA